MPRFLRILLVLLVALLPAQAEAGDRNRVVILVSIDGFKPAYLDRGVTPNLTRLAREGASGPMRPVFPSKTFPNHWTLVTGLVPDHHGIVGNRMEDPARPGETFTMANDDPFWWNAAEPIWVMAENAGIRTATMFWPGANVAWGGNRSRPNAMVTGGKRPADWQQFNQALTGLQRVNAVLDWMRRPAAIRPRLATLYFDTVDTAGHDFGPDDPRTTAAVAEVDGLIGQLVNGLKALRIKADLVIVADHGMATVSSERTIAFDKLADPQLFRIIESGPYAALAPTEGNAERLWAALAEPGPNHTCWRKADIPPALRYGQHARVAPIVCLARRGWQLVPTAPGQTYTGGAHGYDNADPEMAALFIGHGPGFRRDIKLEAFDNLAITPLLRHLLGLPALATLDGTTQPLQKALRQ